MNCLKIILLFLVISIRSYGINPFIASASFIRMWNGQTYVPYPVKGLNFGVTTPGKFPGEMNVSKNQYSRWLKEIQEAGFNTIRLYTLHFPGFYEVLDSFNLANKNSPIFILQGVWLEETDTGNSHDLMSLDQSFTNEIEENVDCIHGNRTISTRVGKAYGNYSRNVSQWMMGYVIGREVIPEEVLLTDLLHSSQTSFTGNYFSISNATPTEAWITSKLDHLAAYEDQSYHIQFPLSFSSWPTLDPMRHPTEQHSSEDTASIDLANIQFSSLSAGYFVSYHAYPYYPDFISKDAAYQSCYDYAGQNSYICYLQDLQQHYGSLPLLIAETGCPSSWGVAHFAQDGINHGGFDELEQGENNIRLAKNISELGLAGSVMFNWMDEWFKKTWITDPFDNDPDRRILWHNATAAEQNFGLLGFHHNNSTYSTILQTNSASGITAISAKGDYDFFSMKINMPEPDLLDTICIALDTYDPTLGESLLPNGKTVSNRAEFFLVITNYKAELYVTEAYDTYGYWHGVMYPNQLLRSIPTDGKPWNLVRWKNNDRNDETQFIGRMRVNRLGAQQTSLDAVRIFNNYIEIRLPWTMLNVTDPSSLSVLDENDAIPGLQSSSSDGILPTVFYKNDVLTPPVRFSWQSWNVVNYATEYLKESYNVVKEKLYQLPGGPVAKTDSFIVTNTTLFTVQGTQGLLKNDLVLLNQRTEATEDIAPAHGILTVLRNGGITYIPEPGFNGVDTFTYRVFSGPLISEAATVSLSVTGNGGWADIYPNPGSGPVSINALTYVSKVEIYNSEGVLVFKDKMNAKNFRLPVELTPGIYYAKLESGKELLSKKFVIQ